MSKDKPYRVPINKTLLKSFFVDAEFPQKEIDKVIYVVMRMHFSKFMSEFDSIKNLVYEALIQRRSQFKPDGDAYNYSYTITRNCLGNYFRRESRLTEICESIVKTDIAADDGVNSDVDFDDPVKEMITGDSDEEVIRISKDKVLYLVMMLTKATPSQELRQVLEWKTPLEVSAILVKFFKEYL